MTLPQPDSKEAGAEAGMDHGDVIDLRHVKWHPCEAPHITAGLRACGAGRLKCCNQTIRQQETPCEGRRPQDIPRGQCWLRALLAMAGHFVQAQDFPTKPVRIIVPFAPGGLTPAVRPAAQNLYEFLGQPFVDCAAPTASSAAMPSRAPPDGYTLVVIRRRSRSPEHLREAAVRSDSRFHAGRLARDQRHHFHSEPNGPVRSVKDFIALAKANPGKLTHGSSGTGGLLHLGAEP
jgi:hypothetical protein